MRLRRTAFVALLAGQPLVFFACSTGPSTGTTTTTTTGTGGMGGMDGGACVHVDHYDICGACALCLEEKCCPELTACVNTDRCIPCVGNDPNAVGPCWDMKAVGDLLQCSHKCEPCYPADPPDCGNTAMHPGGGGNGGSDGSP